jgi:soluble lytic murein transglycosylase-like protein
MTKGCKAAIALLAFTASAQAADLAVLRNGNSIRHERRQVLGAITRLYLSDSSSGYIEIPTSEILRFEVDTAIPATAVPARAPAASPEPRADHAPAIPPAQASAVTRAELNSMIAGAGQRHQIDPDFINSVIRAESGFHSNAVSRKGAQGLMQLMPGTASDLGVTNPFDPNSNVEGGTKYLRELLEKYDFDPVKALAAYNAGSTRVDKYHGVPPYYETQAYIARIIRDYNRRKIAENPALATRSKAVAKPHSSGTGANANSGAPAQQKPSRKAGVGKAAMAALSPEPSR